MYKTWKDRVSFLDARRSGKLRKLDEDQLNELKKINEENRDASASTIKSIWEKTCPFRGSIRLYRKKRDFS